MLDTNAIYLVLGLAYIAAVGWYVINVFIAGKPAKKSGSGSGASKGRKKRSGKKCPQCKKIIDARRMTCQHCGYEFSTQKSEESHPDESEELETEDDMAKNGGDDDSED